MDSTTDSVESKSQASTKSIALYVTCLINSCRPEIAWDCVSLLESLGFRVDIPMDQSCCGQPGYNGGHDITALAQQQIACLEAFDYVVIPSGSCAGMIINHYPTLFDPHSEWARRSQELAQKTHELSDFLLKQGWAPKAKVTQTDAYEVNFSHHTSCSCRRETRSHGATEALLQRLNIPLVDFEEQEVCCGFGGSFSEKFSAISQRMALNKLEQIERSGGDTVVAADLGCLLHLEACAARLNKTTRFMHLAQVLKQHGGHSQ